MWILVLALVATSAIARPAEEQTNKTETQIDNDELPRILQAPIYVRSLESTDETPSYLPEDTEDVESEEAQTTDSTYSVAVPSVMLQAPREGAVDSYALHAEDAYPYEPLIEIAPENLQKKPTTYKNYYSQDDSYFPINPISRQLDLPLPNAPIPFSNSPVYPPVPSTELQLPNLEPYNQQFNPNFAANVAQVPPLTTDDLYKLSLEMVPPPPPYPTPSLELEVPRAESIKPFLNVPTQIFPKKFNPNLIETKYKKPLKSVPVIEFTGDEADVTTKSKKANQPQKLVYQPEYEKERYKFENAQKKLQARKQKDLKKQKEMFEETRPRNVNAEQEASETGYNEFDQGFEAPASHGISEGSGDRTEFQMHGQHGPHSYKFGYDTGKGKNRQFRYEERDNDGYVKGHYGFYNKNGKLQVVNYDAHPHHGFHAEGSFGKV